MNEYISREAIINEIEEEIGVISEPDNRDALINMGLKIALRDAKRLPAADVQPVKRGRWSECYTDSHHYSGICSVCGRASIKSLTESLYEYCPKCGARMDGDSE